MSNSAFPQTGEAWLSQDPIHWLPLINFLFPRSPFQVFNLSILFAVKPPFRVFNLTLFFFLVLTALSGFHLKPFPFFFSFLAKTALSCFQFWQVFLLVASSIIHLDYISVDGTGELSPIHFSEYQCSSWECLLHNIRSFLVGWPFSTGVLPILRNPFEH